MSDHMENDDILKDAGLSAGGLNDCNQAPRALEGKHIYQPNTKGQMICIYCELPKPDRCEKSPLHMDGQHVYEIEGRCIYCGEKNPEAEKVQENKKSNLTMKMTIEGLDMLAGVLEMNGSIEAAKTRVDGMKADNEGRKGRDESPAYTGDDFEKEANNIDFYVRQLRLMKSVINK